MCDLEQSIAEWRRQMLAAGIKRPVPLEELESHLRDEVEQQMRAGLTEQNAFEAAVRRLGHARALKDEFERVHATCPVLQPRYLRVFCFCAAPLMLLVNLWIFLPDATSPMDLGLVTTSLMALYVGGLPFFYRSLPSCQNRLVQAAMLIGYVFALLWPLLATFNSLGIVHLNLGIVVEMIIWSVGAAWFATWLAYAVCGQGNTVGNASPPQVCE